MKAELRGQCRPHSAGRVKDILPIQLFVNIARSERKGDIQQKSMLRLPGPFLPKDRLHRRQSSMMSEIGESDRIPLEAFGLSSALLGKLICIIAVLGI